MEDVQFKEKIVGFVDILGFKSMVSNAERGGSPSLKELLSFREKLGTAKEREFFERHGPRTCPHAPRIKNDLEFQLTQVSDCAIVSAEVSPAGMINVISEIWGSVIELLVEGVMCRGYITRGQIFHEGSDFIGSGYQRAIDRESQVSAFKSSADERGTPFVEIDASICQYAAEQTDRCVREMYSRLVQSDGELTALFPFKRLAHSFIFAGHGVKFDPEKERRSNQNVRDLLTRTKEKIWQYVDKSNPSAVSKAGHYIRMLDAQYTVCDKTDEIIEKLRRFEP